MITLVNWKDSDISIIVHITKDEEQWLADCSTFGKAVNLNSSGSPGMLPLLHILFNIFVIFMQTCSRVSFSSKVVFDYGAFFMLIHNPHLCLENLNLVCYECSVHFLIILFYPTNIVPFFYIKQLVSCFLPVKIFVYWYTCFAPLFVHFFNHFCSYYFLFKVYVAL